MRRIVKKILEILDGTPAEYNRQPQRGQSLIEMTLITPLIVILIAGTVEIGWFAGNYLTLLEVSRVGARRGATLSSENGPLAWDNDFSLHGRNAISLEFDPQRNFYNLSGGDAYPKADCDDTSSITYCREEWEGTPDFGFRNNETTLGYSNSMPNRRDLARTCPPPNIDIFPFSTVGFYNLVLCQMIQAMDPLEIRRYETGTLIELPLEDQTDDIIISVFAVQMVNLRPIAEGGDVDLYGGPNSISGQRLSTVAVNHRTDPNLVRPNEFDATIVLDVVTEYPGYVPVVVGRYPTNANECNVFLNTINDAPFVDNRVYERDPFNWIENNNGFRPDAVTIRNRLGVDVGVFPLEVAYQLEDDTWFTSGYDELPEVQRGFVYTGYHQVEDVAFPFEVTIPDPDNPGAELTVIRDFPVICYGSERTIYWLQEQLLTSGFILSDQEIQRIRNTESPVGSGIYPYAQFGLESLYDQWGFPLTAGTTTRAYDQRADFPPDFGMILVEIYWRHELLLDLPVYSPVFQALGDNQTVIHVWSAFTVPTASPALNFDQVCQDFTDNPDDCLPYDPGPVECVRVPTTGETAYYECTNLNRFISDGSQCAFDSINNYYTCWNHGDWEYIQADGSTLIPNQVNCAASPTKRNYYDCR